MNNYRRFVVAVIILELIILVLGNIFFHHYTHDTGDRLYRVETRRVAEDIALVGVDGIDISEYKTIVEINEYNKDIRSDYDYVIEEVDGKLYQISYMPITDNKEIIIFNASLTATITITILILAYVGKKIIRPFRSMNQLTYELAKGNLSAPIKEEKSKYFGKFLWGMDMLREKLEEEKTKELRLQKEKKMMVLSLSHDIKTPLSAIELYSKALEENLYESEEKRTEVIEGISSNAKKIRTYVDEIILASREDFLNLQVVMGEYYLSEIVNAIRILYEEKLSLLHTSFEISTYEDCLLEIDKDRLIEVFQNVIENAIKYGDGKSILMSFSEEEDCKLITIENTGCTLEEGELTSIFDSFYRGRNSSKISGNGLGLYICKNLARKMDGEIYASIKGDRFNVTVVVHKT